MPDPALRPADPVAAIATEVRRMQDGLGRIAEAVTALRAEREAPSRPRRPRPERHLALLLDVYERGGRPGLSSEELGRRGGYLGYDRRGLGGFFAGAFAPLRLSEGRVTLTPEGRRLIDAHLKDS